jgi:NADH-quinone oxidoreductase subunit L
VKANNAAAAEPAATEADYGEKEMELALTGVSVLAAGFGIFMAWLFYVKKPELPGRVTAGLGGLYNAVYNKYYVDEAYQLAVVDPIVDGSRSFLWRIMDVGIIDGAVNGAGGAAKWFSGEFRQMQSGNIRSYAGWVALGAACVLLYTFWMGMQ